MSPWLDSKPLSEPEYQRVRKDVIFHCGKWDPQVEDTNTIASEPIILKRGAWQELKATAELLHAEAIAAEEELADRPDLHRKLGLSRALCSALRRSRPSSLEDVRVMRFDFHFTRSGWMISEVNSDVPGGFNEASGMSKLFAELYPETEVIGDPARDLADQIAQRIGPSGIVALVHATAYTDDRQVMVFLGRALERAGLSTHLVAPDNVRWRRGRAGVVTDWYSGTVDYLVRFFPVEWMPNLPERSEWSSFLTGATPASNPGRAAISQTKRFPIVWDELNTPVPTWRRALPETRCPKSVNWQRDEEWVLKPAFGRVGDGIGLRGQVEMKNWVAIARDAGKHPLDWAAQRRFEAIPTPSGLYPCFGVFTINGRAAGVYGRATPRPLIDHRAKDIAVLMAGSEA